MFSSNFLILSFHLTVTPWGRLEEFSFVDRISNWREGCVDQVIIWRCGLMNECCEICLLAKFVSHHDRLLHICIYYISV